MQLEFIIISFIKMPSYLLSTLTLVLAGLFASQQASAAPAENAKQCIANAYTVYDNFTKNGCTYYKTDESCVAGFDYFIKKLNDDLDKCERTDYVTLCHFSPGSILGDNCSAGIANGKLTKAECEAEASKDFTQHYADGTSRVYKASDAKCINAIDYDCFNLCR